MEDCPNINFGSLVFKKSFVDIVKGSTSLNGNPLSVMTSNLKAPTEYRDGLAVEFSKDEIAELSEPYKWALIRKFSSGRPNFDVIKSFIHGFTLNGVVSFGMLDSKHVLINLSTEEDFTRIWCRRALYVKGFLMRILKWEAGFRPDRESPMALVWLYFRRLPAELFAPKALCRLALGFGKPMLLDTATTNGSRLSQARILVEMDVRKEFKSKIWISVEGNNGFWQSVELENKPSYCDFCYKLGHAVKDCKVKNPELRSVFHAKAQKSKGDENSDATFQDVGINPIENAVAVDISSIVEIANVGVGISKGVEMNCCGGKIIENFPVIISDPNLKESFQNSIQALSQDVDAAYLSIVGDFSPSVSLIAKEINVVVPNEESIPNPAQILCSLNCECSFGSSDVSNNMNSMSVERSADVVINDGYLGSDFGKSKDSVFEDLVNDIDKNVEHDEGVMVIVENDEGFLLDEKYLIPIE